MNGNGTQESPYEITTYAELVADKEQGKYYKLMNNIDCHTEGHTSIKTSGTPTDSSLYAQIDLNGKSIICPIFNSIVKDVTTFRSLHIYNGNIFDIYAIQGSSTNNYLIRACIFDDVSMSIHWEAEMCHLQYTADSVWNYFNRCYIKVSGTFKNGSFGGDRTLFDSCTIKYDNVSDYYSSDVYCNYCYFDGKIIVKDSQKDYSWGVFAIAGKNNTTFGNQNIINLTIDNTVGNPSTMLSFMYLSGLSKNVYNKDKVTSSNDTRYAVSSSDLLSPLALISKGMQISEVV